jgi:predicted aldo/keto reductase-like oxidoreductase
METLIWAKEQGYARNIGFTCHRDNSALAIMQRAEFATMLFPVNFAYREQKGGSIEAVKKAKENGLGVIAIKGIANRLWRDGEEKTFPKCWYRPIYDNDPLAQAALNYTLSQDIDIAVPPGDAYMLRLALTFVKKQGGAPAPLSDKDLDMIRKAAAEIKEPIF